MNNERIQFIIDNLQETLEIEVKNWLDGLCNNESKAKLAKELIALANHGGGLLFIGFEESKEGHPEITPKDEEAKAFSQDAVANIIQKYAEPPFQCEIGYFKRTGSNISHPVIEVTGGHRTPIFAKSGSPDGQKLQSGIVYVRRPGGYSEPCRIQDDWEKLLDRLVKSRQTEQLEAIREILNPQTYPIAHAEDSLEQWDSESYQTWNKLIDQLPPQSPHRLASGHWTFSFSINPIQQPTLAELNDALERQMPRLSGWPPFTYLHQQPKRPNAYGETVQAWLVDPKNTSDTDPCRSDFWRVSRDGYGFLLRPMQEDDPHFASNIHPRPAGPHFDWTLPIYRSVELLKYVEAFAERFSDENAKFNTILRYYKTNGRRLINREWDYSLRENNTCALPNLESKISGKVHSLRTNIEERVYSLLTPIFEQFQFAQLPKQVSDDIVKKALRPRR